MFKKLVLLLTLILFTASTFSCYTTKIEKIEPVVSRANKKEKILEVMKTSREWIEFIKKEPGKIVKETIVGKVVIESGKRTKLVSIPLFEVKFVKIKRFRAGKTLLTIICVPILLPLFLSILSIPASI